MNDMLINFLALVCHSYCELCLNEKIEQRMFISGTIFVFKWRHLFGKIEYIFWCKSVFGSTAKNEFCSSKEERIGSFQYEIELYLWNHSITILLTVRYYSPKKRYKRWIAVDVAGVFNPYMLKSINTSNDIK